MKIAASFGDLHVFFPINFYYNSKWFCNALFSINLISIKNGSSSSTNGPYIMKVHDQVSRWRRDTLIVFIYFWSKVAQVTLTELDSICKNAFLFIQMQISKIKMTIIITIISPEHLYTARMWKYMDRNVCF